MPSYTLMGIMNGSANSKQTLKLSLLGEACARMDLAAIHEILEKVGYKDDEGLANDVRSRSLFSFLFIHSFLLLLTVG